MADELKESDEFTALESDRRKMAHQRELLATQIIDTAVYNTQIELFRSVITMGQNALKYAVMVNGGAAVSFIAVLSSHLSELIVGTKTDCIYWCLWWALFFFGLGTILAVIGVGMSYMAQRGYMDIFSNVEVPKLQKALKTDGEYKSENKTNGWHKTCVGCVIFSYAMLFLGMVVSGSGFWRILSK